MTYAQRDEEHWIGQMEGTGRYLDVGAFDGSTFSNVRMLAERGWEGVCVEPGAFAFAALADDPPPGAKLVHALVGPKTGLASFMLSRDAVSSTSRAHAHKWKEAVRFTPIFTVSISPADLLRDFPGPYRLVNIDTESTSMWLFHQLSPLFDDLETEMVCVEHDGAQVHLDGFHEVYRSPENSIIRRT